MMSALSMRVARAAVMSRGSRATAIWLSSHTCSVRNAQWSKMGEQKRERSDAERRERPDRIWAHERSDGEIAIEAPKLGGTTMARRCLWWRCTGRWCWRVAPRPCSCWFTGEPATWSRTRTCSEGEGTRAGSSMGVWWCNAAGAPGCGSGCGWGVLGLPVPTLWWSATAVMQCVSGGVSTPA